MQAAGNVGYPAGPRSSARAPGPAGGQAGAPAGGQAAAPAGGQAAAPADDSRVVVGLDNGGTSNNATVMELTGRFAVDTLVEVPSRVHEGPVVATTALVEAFDRVLEVTGTPREAVVAVGFDTPGPASAEGVISSRGSTNFSEPAWRSFDFRTALEERLGLPVVYSNDGNAAALYAHSEQFGPDAGQRSSVSAIIGTGFGGGLIESGRIVAGAVGMAGELGHVHIPLQGLLVDDQPLPACNCGFVGDAESVASLTAITKNLLPFWLTRYPEHPLASVSPLAAAARQVRAYGERGDEMARAIFTQQAMAIGRLFTIAANFTDPHAYFLGGGVVEAEAEFSSWFLDEVRRYTLLRAEQAGALFAVVPHRDMAGARGSALAAATAVAAGTVRSPGSTS